MERESLKALLLKEKEELSARIQKIDRHNHEKTVSKQFDEQAVERINDEVVRNLEIEGRGELQAIEKALARIDSDHFASCSGCGETISDERLTAIPHTMVCRNCAT